MKLRPCIDIHNGKVKQIVGGSLKDQGNQAEENFVSEKDAAWYADFYMKDQLSGGHIILLNKSDSEFFPQTKQQALMALRAQPGCFQIGGGITAENAREYLEAGASHVIVTSYVFSDGKINYQNLEKLCSCVGKKQITLDLSCRKRGDAYYIVTDRWQKFTDTVLTVGLMKKLEDYCDEYLIHAVDVEGKQSGPDSELVELLSRYAGRPVTYAGGIRGEEDLRILKEVGNNRLDVTIGSALDLFGGPLSYEKIKNLS